MESGSVTAFLLRPFKLILLESFSIPMSFSDPEALRNAFEIEILSPLPSELSV